ncbi:FAD-binding oxidoreductase [Cupriavidus sp. L7L]|uniref:NAD(P)/FAD-dependent oxidoreductase n=1 Tax=Cupriavidus sp. L7L TaxID=2546443 RepID=UPI0010550775|nr:FAD-dependent oxidoreductase [Cupriavidus sp. L7L]TDF63191.1 FAD-dependent oxidoreductase [Cupriavidus sp. L7L]
MQWVESVSSAVADSIPCWKLLALSEGVHDPKPFRPKDMNSSSCDPSVAIVGAGIVGLSIAIAFQRAGYRVTIYDRQQPMHGCSFGNAGYLSQANIFPPATPDLLLRLPSMMMSKDGPLVVRPSYLPTMLPWAWRAARALHPRRSTQIASAMAGLTQKAGPFLETYAAYAGASHLISRDGALVVFKNKRALEEKCAALPLLARHGVNASFVTTSEIGDLEPALTHELAGGLLFPAAGRCSNPRGLGEQYLTHLTTHGALFVQAAVRNVSVRSQGGASVTTDSGTTTYDRLVLASGIDTAAFMRDLGYRAPLAAERGYHLMLPHAQVTLRRPVLFAEPYFVATPMDEGLRLAGTAEFAHPSSPPNMSRAFMLHRLAGTYLPKIAKDQAQPWMGVRPTTPDGMPIIGSIANDRIIYAFGHGHNGLTLSAATAECVLAIAGRTKTPVDLKPFSVRRFS